MSRSYDGVAVWQRGAMTMALGQPIYSEPDVVTRPNGTWVMFARNSTGGLSFYDARPGRTPPEPRRSRSLVRSAAGCFVCKPGKLAPNPQASRVRRSFACIPGNAGAALRPVVYSPIARGVATGPGPALPFGCAERGGEGLSA